VVLAGPGVLVIVGTGVKEGEMTGSAGVAEDTADGVTAGVLDATGVLAGVAAIVVIAGVRVDTGTRTEKRVK
jgi:hypothetical protein